jgi:benzoate/toluate 1,2-dioxygenase reductase subunit
MPQRWRCGAQPRVSQWWKTMNEAPDVAELKWPEGMAPFDLRSVAIQADPFKYYEWLRTNAPVLKARAAETDVWFISRYDDVKATLLAPKIFSSETADPKEVPFIGFFDAPRHSALRSIVAGAFTPKFIARYESDIRALAETYLDPLVQSGGGEIVGDFATRLTVDTISPSSRIGAKTPTRRVLNQGFRPKGLHYGE